MNEYLYEIAEICKIKKKITCHVARHSFATLCMTEGVPIESISKMLGHSNIRTTQTYARVIDQKLSNDMALFAEKLEKNKVSSKFDQLFEDLSLSEKMTLFNLPSTLSNDPERVKRISMMWHSLSDEEKTFLWSNTFLPDKTLSGKSMMKLVINQ